jgi:hypothetical protein
MRNRSFVVGGVLVSVALLLGPVDQPAVSASVKGSKASCSKKNVGAVVGGRICTRVKQRYLWVAAPSATTVASGDASVRSVITIPDSTGLGVPDTQRINGPGGAWVIDVPASWNLSTKIQGAVTASDGQTGAELWLGLASQRPKFAQVVADNPKFMKSQYGVNLSRSEPGVYAGSVIQTLWYVEPGSSKRIVVRLYERELVGGFLTAEITVKSEEAGVMLLGSLDKMEIQWRTP